ncbi:hypothetical protein SAMN05216337_1001154 [Bradyrhizobium brasilense]|uniref:Uncharacterized protein n=1 Tax=Bradyrhizobium brasilense TaxID=1419277 RepID=A0A1G6IJB8_9BRAD|nr:hypothetical protein [Bradyrhizobium brasilense]SDC06085.1 hypothetical protein SAMN05216337_1001154 [Bradyrhizobium brasilense]
MSLIVPIILRLAALAGLKLSPFAAGAALAGVLAVALAGAGAATGLKIYNAGQSSAESECQAAALQARIDTLEADQAIGRRALADARLKVTALEEQSEQDRKGTADYVEDLKKSYQAACALTDDDLRGLRAQGRAGRGPAAKGAAGGTGQSHAPGRHAPGLTGR